MSTHKLLLLPCARVQLDHLLDLLGAAWLLRNASFRLAKHRLHPCRLTRFSTLQLILATAIQLGLTDEIFACLIRETNAALVLLLLQPARVILDIFFTYFVL